MRADGGSGQRVELTQRLVVLAMTVIVISSIALPLVTLPAAASGHTCTQFDGGPITNSGCYELSSGTTDNSSTYVTIAASDVVLDGMGHTVDGDDSSSVSGIVVNAGTSNVTVENLSVTDYETGIRIDGSSTNRTEDVTLGNITVSSGEWGLDIVHATDVSIDSTTVRDGSNDGVTFTQSADSRIANSVIESIRGSIDQPGLVLMSSTNITVENVTVTDTDDGIQIENTNRSSIIESEFSGGGLGISAGYDPFESGSIPHNLTIANTTVTNHTGDGIRLGDGLVDASIRDNTVTENNHGIVVRLTAGADADIIGLEVRDNVVRNNDGVGIELEGDEGIDPDPFFHRDARLLNNTVEDNGNLGVLLFEVENVTMRDNVISGHAQDFEIGDEITAPDTELNTTYFRHDIDTSNTVDGEPLRYLRNATGVTVDASTSVGALVVVDSSSVVVRDQAFGNASVTVVNTTDSRFENLSVEATGFHALESTNLTVQGSRFEPTTTLGGRGTDQSRFGVRVIRSDAVTVADTTTVNATVDVVVEGTGNGNVIRNLTTISGPTLGGVGIQILWGATGTRVVDSRIVDNQEGIRIGNIGQATNTTIENTTVADNDKFGGGYGIRVSAPGARIIGGNVSGNGETGIDTTNLAEGLVVWGTRIDENGLHGVDIENGATDVSLTDVVIRSNDRHGILVDAANATVENATIEGHTNAFTAGINDIFDRSDNLSVVGGSFVGNRVGIDFSSDSLHVDGTTIRNATHAIRLDGSSDTVVRNVTVTNATAWAYLQADAGGSVVNNSATNVTIDGNVTASWVGREIGVNGVENPPSNPSGYDNVSAFLNVTNTSATGYANLTVSYTDADASGVDESSLRLWHHNGTSWSQLPPPNSVDVTNNTVQANVTTFSTIAPLGTAGGTPPPTPTPTPTPSPTPTPPPTATPGNGGGGGGSGGGGSGGGGGIDDIPTPTPTATPSPTPSPTSTVTATPTRTERASPTTAPTSSPTTDAPTETPDGQPGFTLVITIVALAAMAMLARRRR